MDPKETVDALLNLNWGDILVLFIVLVGAVYGLFKLMIGPSRNEIERLSNELKETKSELSDMREEYSEVKAELEETTAAKNYRYIHGMYWTPAPSGIHIQVVGAETNDGPFCPRCLETKGKVVSVQPDPTGVMTCISCGWSKPTEKNPAYTQNQNAYKTQMGDETKG